MTHRLWVQYETEPLFGRVFVVRLSKFTLFLSPPPSLPVPEIIDGGSPVGLRVHHPDAPARARDPAYNPPVNCARQAPRQTVRS